MRRPILLLALGLSLAAGATTFRSQLGQTFRVARSMVADLLDVLLAGSKGVTTVATDPCSTVSGIVGGFVGPNAFCLGPTGLSDGGTQVDGGALVAFTAGAATPTALTTSRCPNGPECAATTFQRFDGGTGASYASANTADIAGDLSCVFTARRWGASGAQYPITKTLGAGGPLLSYFSATTLTAQVFGADGGATSVTASNDAQLYGAWETYGISYHYVSDLASTLVIYRGGIMGTPSNVAVGPLRSMLSGWRISGYAATAGLLDGDIAFITCSEANWTAAQHAAIAQAMRANWTEQVTGGAITTTRASTQYCDPLDGGFGTWLRVNEPCIVGGAYLSEPAATNQVFNSGAMNLWTNSSVTQTADTDIAPDGTLSADTLTSTIISGYVVATMGTISGTNFTQSVWAKTPTGTQAAQLVLYDATIPAYLPVCDFTLTTTWQRLICTTPITTGHSINWAFRPGGAGVGTAIAWGAQGEVGTVATSYIATASTALTRAATAATVANPLYGLNPTVYCFGGTIDPKGVAWANRCSPFFCPITTIGGPAWVSANLSALMVANDGKVGVYANDGSAAQRYRTSVGAISLAAHELYGCNDMSTNPTTMTVYVDGVAVPMGAYSGAGTGIVASQPATLYLGNATGYPAPMWLSKERVWAGGYR